jgi:hypothetical protein
MKGDIAMKHIRLIVILSSFCIFSACASGIKYTEYQSKIPAQSADTGRIFFYRASSLGAALRPDVLLNNEKVGQAISYGFFYVDRPAGDYQVVTSTEVTRKLSFVLEKGQSRYVRFSTNFGFFVGHVYGELVDPEVGKKEIQDCKYTGTP